MSSNLIYCPNCDCLQPFIRVDKYVRIYELSRDDTEAIHVIQCDECGYPIAAYPEPPFSDTPFSDVSD